ncbi:MAG: NAD(P)H-binding protein, partial [Pseudomonadota bacterium]
AAAASAVRQLILHGSVGAGDSASAYADRNLSAGMARLMAAKTAGENAVIESGIRYTIIRNSHLLPHGTEPTGEARLYGDVTLTGAVTRAGLARLTAECILAEPCLDKTFHAVDKTLR